MDTLCRQENKTGLTRVRFQKSNNLLAFFLLLELNHLHFWMVILVRMNFGVYRPGNYKGHIQTPLSRLHLDGDSNPGPPGRRSRALPQSYIPAKFIDKTTKERYRNTKINIKMHHKP